MNGKNGQPISFKWLAITLVGIMITGGSMWMTNISARVNAIEIEVSALKVQNRDIDRRLERIENKLDILLDVR